MLLGENTQEVSKINKNGKKDLRNGTDLTTRAISF
jgi:hypothetical protein